MGRLWNDRASSEYQNQNTLSIPRGNLLFKHSMPELRIKREDNKNKMQMKNKMNMRPGAKLTALVIGEKFDRGCEAPEVMFFFTCQSGL